MDDIHKNECSAFEFSIQIEIPPPYLSDPEAYAIDHVSKLANSNMLHLSECVCDIKMVHIKQMQIIGSSIVANLAIQASALFPEKGKIFTGIVTAIIANRLATVSFHGLHCIFVRLDANSNAPNVGDTTKVKIDKLLFTKGVTKLIGTFC